MRVQANLFEGNNAPPTATGTKCCSNQQMLQMLSNVLRPGVGGDSRETAAQLRSTVPLSASPRLAAAHISVYLSSYLHPYLQREAPTF